MKKPEPATAEDVARFLMRNGTPYSRRKASLEAKVVAQVRDGGGFSVFWATESLERARAIQRLTQRGVIVRKTGRGWGRFPWCGYRLNSLFEK